MGRTLIILGAGGHGKSVAEAALASGDWQDIRFVDDRWPQLQQCFGWPVVANVAGLAALSSVAQGAIAAVGSNRVRQDWVAAIRAAGLPLVSIIHPSAVVSPSARIGAGTAIMALAMVGVDVSIGEAAIVNAHSTVDHDASLGDHAHLGVGVHIAGGVKVGNRSWLQAGCCAGYRVIVADDAEHAPGSALLAEPAGAG